MKKIISVVFVCLIALSCNSYSGDYTDSFGLNSMSLNSDGSFETASCNGKWEEVEGGIKIYDVIHNGFGRSNCNYEGFYKSYKNAYNEAQSFKHDLTGVCWIKE